MAECPQCGERLTERWEWCPKCGAEVEAEDGSLDFDDLESTDERISRVMEAVELQGEAPPQAIPLAPMTTIEIQPVVPADQGPIMAVPAKPAPLPPRVVRGRKKRRVRRAPTARRPITAPTAETGTELTVKASSEFASIPVDDPPVMGVLLEIEAVGEPIVDAAAGPVAHVILALDLSASMNRPDKYPLMKDAVLRMFRDLKGSGSAEVLVSVVIYSRGSEVILSGTSAWEVDEADLFATIEGHPLCFGDYTDSPGALGKAGRIAFDQRKRNRTLPVRVYLLTDGKPQDTEGFAKTTEMLGRVTADIHALAFGADADMVELQERFAGKRGGTVKSVRKDTIGSAFERVAEVAQKVVATRCLVEFELAPGVTGGDAFRYRPARVRFPEPAFSAGKTFSTDLGTIETGRTYTLLFELRPQETEYAVTPIGKFTVQIPGVGGAITKTFSLVIPRTPEDSAVGELNTDVRTARDILGTLTDEDPETALRALRLRRQIYAQERRDPGLIAVLDRAIELLETHGDLEGLTPGEQATLMSHTCS